MTVTSPCDGRSITSTKYIDLGLPQISSFLINGSTHGGGGLYVCTGNSQYIQPQPTNSSYSYNWSLSFGNPGNGNLASYGNAASFTPYSAECFGVSVQATNGCGTTSSGVTICGQNCFARYAVYPNPARDYITIQFDEVDKAEALPDQIDLLADASTKPIKTVNVQDTYSGKTFKNGNQVEIDARDLPRGTYYLHIKNSRRTDKEIDAIRIVLE